MAAYRIIQYAVLPLQIACLLVINCVLTTLSAFSSWWRQVVYDRFLEVMEVRQGDPYLTCLLNVSDYRYFWRRLKFFMGCAWAEARMEAEAGGKAPNPRMLRLSDKSECHLLDLALPGRPFVINFGSCT
nr:uncharacterized protein LOC123765862 isoform X1 [Procambarus clarkii]